MSAPQMGRLPCFSVFKCIGGKATSYLGDCVVGSVKSPVGPLLITCTGGPMLTVLKKFEHNTFENKLHISCCTLFTATDTEKVQNSDWP